LPNARLHQNNRYAILAQNSKEVSAVRQCEHCKKDLSTNEVGISLRLMGRNGKKFLCRECLAQELKVDTEVIDRKIEQFRQQGCPLFV